MERTNPSSATVSPADSSFLDLPEPGGLCAVHQPNLFPRLTTLAKLFAADYWIVLDGGRLLEAGTHESLLDDDGEYAAMWRTQARTYSDLPQG